MEQDYVTPYTGNVAFPALIYSPETPWQAEGISCIEKILDMLLQVGNVPFTEYRIAMLCTQLWYDLIVNCRDSVGQPTRSEVRKQQRIRDMLTFIHTNYAEQITLGEVAEAAHVSEGECCRCFSSMVRKSPMQYLQWYRVTKGQELLGNSDLSITETAFACGFNDASHFIQYFRRQVGLTPKEYRQGILRKES